MAGQAFQAHRGVHQLGDIFVRVVYFLQLRALLQRVFQGDIEAVGDEFRHAVAVAVWHCERAGDIADAALRAECAEGDYLRHMLFAVLFDDIVDDLFAAVVLEVHVDVGHFLTLDIQETLEYEPVRERVDIGYAEAVQHEACRRAAAHGEEYVAPVHELGDVPDD